MQITSEAERLIHPQLKGKPNAIKSELIKFIESAQSFKEESKIAISKGSKLVAQTIQHMDESISLAQEILKRGILDDHDFENPHIADLLSFRAQSSLAQAA
ncbi:hypothetical protein [Vibrio owensii]|uniref:hypothetical protein n=1 Tax=Vibrio harveyi group TaxID=717610 RepID=UPI003CC6BC54